MKTLLAAVAGALAIGGVLFAYELGSRRAVDRDALAPTTQMLVGPDGVARPYLVSAQPLDGQTPYATATAWSPYAPAAPARVQYANERVVSEPVVRRVSTRRVATEPISSERTMRRRTWQKSALLIGGSSIAGAGMGALIGGKRGALAGAVIGGGAAAIYDQSKRR